MAISFNEVPVVEDAEARKQRIKDALQENIRQVVRHLYPKAVLSKRDARIGDAMGSRGQSMSIALTPGEAGQWIDHATNERGDVLTLIERALHLNSFADVLTEAEAIIGGKPTERQIVRQAVMESHTPEEKPSVIDTVEHIYRSKEGRRIATVYRDTLSNGKKTFRVHRSSDSTYAAPDPRPLYRLPDLSSADQIVLCEGEKCADALNSIGIVATTAMFGSNTQLTKIDWSPLAGKAIMLWPDNDEPGHAYMDRVKPVLETLGCSVKRIIIPPDKPKGWDAADAASSGEDIRALIEQAGASKRRLPIMSVADLAHMKPPEWLIDELLVEKGMSSLFAPSETFKSFIALDMALSIASGYDWRGRSTLCGPVVYLIGEGVSGWPSRVFAWLANRGDNEHPDFWTIPTSIALTDREDADALIDAIRSVCEQPLMVVIDTLARNFGEGDENSTQDMNAFVSAIDHVRTELGTHVMLVHHTGKDVEKGGRGSSVLRAALDTEMQVSRPDPEGFTITFKVTKQKDIDKAQPIHFEMRRVEALHPVTKETVTSLVPVLTEVVAEAAAKLSSSDKEVLEFVKSAVRSTKEVAAHFALTERGARKKLRKIEETGQISSNDVEGALFWRFIGVRNRAELDSEG
jgi:5S rRNA maturation endonuclease (ribonuclease M5)